MIEIIEAGELHFSKEYVGQICDLLAPAFRKSNIGESCSAFEFKHLWDTLYQRESPSILFLLMDDKKVVGLLGGVTFDDPLTGLRYAAEVVWRVSPEVGGQGLGLKLLQRFEWWARDRGCNRVVLHSSTKEEIPFCQKVGPRGYNPYRIEFLKELQKEK